MGKIKSFSSCVKDELAREIPKKICCQKAELYVAIRMSGRIKKEKQNFGIKIRTENASVARKTITLIKKLFKEEINTYTKFKSYRNKRKRYFIEIPFQKKTAKFLKMLKYLDDNFEVRDKISSDFIRKKCCKISFLRSCFYSRGYISKPESGYHLEILTNSQDDAKCILKILNGFHINPKIYKRRGFFVVYLKKSEDIFNFLKLIGAYGTVLNLESIKVLKEAKSYIKRIVNFEAANLNKTIKASYKQIDNIIKIDNSIGLDFLPEALREISYIRLEYPQASLSELGKLSSKIISKSAVNNRLRRIRKIVESL